jgi:hypothetical protein
MNDSSVPGFNDREKGFERKFEHDQELAFKIRSRRNKLVGLWAAGQLGLTGDAGETYAKNLVAAGMAKSGDEAITAKLAEDFRAKGLVVDDASIRRELARAADEAKSHFGPAG